MKRVALYMDHGCRGIGAARWAELLSNSPEFEFAMLDAADVKAGGLAGFDCLVMPGGGGFERYDDWGEEGCARIRDFVRGGGGYIRISRVQESARELIMHTVDAVGESLDAGAAESTIHSIRDAELLDEATARVMLSAVGNAALKPAEGALRDQIRANLLKHMLVTYVAE